MRITIVGSGNDTVTAAVDTVSKDHDVKLCCRNQSISRSQNAIEESRFDSNNESNGRLVKFTDISNGMEYVLRDAEVVQAIIPSSYIECYANIMTEHVTDDRLIFLDMAAAMGSIRFVNVLEDKHIETRLQLAEANTLTCGARVDFEDTAVDLSPNARRIFFSTYNRGCLNDCCDRIPSVYGHLVKEESLIKTSLESGNPEMYPGPTLLSVGRIDCAGKFTLYKKGIIEHIVRLLHAIELERLNLGRRLGFGLSAAKESRIERGYLERDKEDEPLDRLFNTSPIFSQIPGPNHVGSRYLTENIAYGLVLWSGLGRVIDVPTPNIDAVIVIVSTILERDFLKEGLTVREISLDKLDLEKYLK